MEDVQYICADIKRFCLETPLDRLECMQMPIDLIPEEFQTTYSLQVKAKNSFVYIKIAKGMYSLPQSGILASKLLKKRIS